MGKTCGILNIERVLKDRMNVIHPVFLELVKLRQNCIYFLLLRRINITECGYNKR